MDLFYGHISGMDALARGLRNAARLLEVGPLLRTPGFRARCPAVPGTPVADPLAPVCGKAQRCTQGRGPRHRMQPLLWIHAESALKVLHAILQEGILPGMVEARYASYSQGLGQKIRAGKVRPGLWPLRMPLCNATSRTTSVATPYCHQYLRYGMHCSCSAPTTFVHRIALNICSHHRPGWRHAGCLGSANARHCPQDVGIDCQRLMEQMRQRPAKVSCSSRDDQLTRCIDAWDNHALLRCQLHCPLLVGRACV